MITCQSRKTAGNGIITELHCCINVVMEDGTTGYIDPEETERNRV